MIGLHAGAGSAKRWKSLAERLRLSYRVLAPKLTVMLEPRPGHGRTALVGSEGQPRFGVME